MLHPFDLPKVMRLGSGSRDLGTFRVRRVGYRPVLVRNGTRDFATLRSTFIDAYHLPPRPLSSNATILDLGSNVGYTVCHFSHLYPDARIVGVEMDEDNIRLARRNTAACTNVTLLHRAVSASSALVTYVKNGTGEDAYRISDETSANSGEVRIQASTIPSLMEETGLTYVDYLKMDIEGEESRIFNDRFNDLWWLERVRMINVEVHYSPLDAVMEILRQHGFTAWKHPQHWSAVMAVK